MTANTIISNLINQSIKDFLFFLYSLHWHTWRSSAVIIFKFVTVSINWDNRATTGESSFLNQALKWNKNWKDTFQQITHTCNNTQILSKRFVCHAFRWMIIFPALSTFCSLYKLHVQFVLFSDCVQQLCLTTTIIIEKKSLLFFSNRIHSD